MSANQVRAAGYAGVDPFFIPPTMTGQLIYEYHRCALTPALAKSNFLREGQLFCGSRAIFGRVKKMRTFGYHTDNNEDPPITGGPQIEPDSLKVCQSFKFDIKLSENDRRFMCANYAEWIKVLQRQVDDNLVDNIDEYSIAVIQMSAHPDNVGVQAGQLNHLINLGGQGGTGNEPLPITTVAEFKRVIDNIRMVTSQAGWRCDSRETPLSGDGVSNPVMVLPAMLEPIVTDYIAEFENGCNCGPTSNFRSGQIGVIRNMDVIMSERLQPANFGGTQLVAPVLVVDPDQILHAMDIIVNKIWEDKFAQHFVGECVYDTHVINKHGVVIANVGIAI